MERLSTEIVMVITSILIGSSCFGVFHIVKTGEPGYKLTHRYQVLENPEITKPLFVSNVAGKANRKAVPK